MTGRLCVGEGERLSESLVTWDGKSVRNGNQRRVLGAVGTAVVVRGWGLQKCGDVGQRAHISKYKMSKFWGSQVCHGD